MNKIKYIRTIIYKLNRKIAREFYRIRYPHIINQINKIHVVGIDGTIRSLINSNKSISRFGDGEIKWMFGNNKYGSFEKPSTQLQNRLLQVLRSNQPNLEIGLPDAFNGVNSFTKDSKDYWEGFFGKYWQLLSRYLSADKLYFDTSMSRFYMDYKNKQFAKNRFKYLTKIWDNKKILIIEGKYSRLGATDNLFNNSKCIKRIECPPVNAFEHYKKILNASRFFLSRHKDFISLLSLGPTATVLAYDLSRLNYRAIDIGHIDMEYEWMLMGAKKRVNIPTKYVNSFKIKGARNVSKISNNEFSKQIIHVIK